MDIVFLLFDGVAPLDAVGPFQVLSSMPGVTVKFAAATPGPQRTEDGFLALHADYSLDDIERADVLVVPGGTGTRRLTTDKQLIGWVQRIHETTQWTTSVCTGSLLLGAAGILEGLEATSHWLELDTLATFGAKPTGRRVVEQGKIITAAGVSSGIDMALTLVARISGDEMAQAIQLAIEYEPQPPFDAGSPEKAPPAIVELVRNYASSRQAS